MSDSQLADRLLDLFKGISLEQLKAPKDIAILDPFNGAHSTEVNRIVEAFHRKFYADNKKRRIMLGINPGRLGAGSTGLSFTDTKRCEADLKIEVNGFRTHEPSSDFFYRMIRSAGGPKKFYSKVYVHAVCPLGFTIKNKAGNAININYYDDKALEKALKPFISKWLEDLISVGFKTDKAYCIGTGKNMKFLSALNKEKGYFEELVALEHPRYVMQYKAKSLELYIEKYIRNVFEN